MWRFWIFLEMLKVSQTPSGPVRHCQCGYPVTPCDKNKHDYGHECVWGNEQAAGIDGLQERGYAALTEKDIEREFARLNERYRQRMLKRGAPPIRIEDLRPTDYCFNRFLLALLAIGAGLVLAGLYGFFS
jgi:hypothetical protein